MSKDIKVSPSILAAPLARLGEAVQKLDSKLIDFIHLDVMDGHFVPALTFGEQISEAIKSETDIPLDVHLMVANPEHEVSKYFKLNPHNITFHYETTDFPVRLAQTIREKKIAAGVALNPYTPIEVLEPLYPYIDLILLMTVEPGYYGQSFLATGIDRLKQCAELCDKLSKSYDGHRPLIEIDGGVSDKNIAAIKAARADMVVAGSYIFKSDDPNERAKKLREA